MIIIRRNGTEWMEEEIRLRLCYRQTFKKYIYKKAYNQGNQTTKTIPNDLYIRSFVQLLIINRRFNFPIEISKSSNQKLYNC